MAEIRSKVLFPTEFGRSQLYSFRFLSDSQEHIAQVFESQVTTQLKAPLVRIHSECLTGDVFASFRCDCGPQLKDFLSDQDESGRVLIYLRQEGRGIGLYNKLDAYVLQQQGLNTFEANQTLGFLPDARNFKVAAEILHALKIFEIRLQTNNPEKALALEQFGIRVLEVVSTKLHINDHNKSYLLAKQESGHLLELAEEVR